MRATIVLLAFISSALAYSVKSPNENKGWTNNGPQLLTWEKAKSDTESFAVILDNQSLQDYEPAVLAEDVDGNSLSTTVNPPQGGWVSGTGYQVNLVRGRAERHQIYAQSPQFEIIDVLAGTRSTSDAVPAISTDANESANTDSSSPYRRED